jgi:hypothetical protein
VSVQLAEAHDVGTWFSERRGYVRCRTLGHSWFDYDSTWTPSFGIPMTLRCERCGTERRDTVSDFGKLLGRRYYKPDNYDRRKGEPVLTRSDFRLVFLAIRDEEASKRKRK